MHTSTKPFLGPLWVIPLLLWMLPARAQNLLPNPSLELYTTCPTSGGQINRCVAWGDNPTYGSTDYFNACHVPDINVGQIVDVPDNMFGHLPAYTGDAYAGILLYSQWNHGYREYLRNRLTVPMLAGMRYRVSFQGASTGSLVGSNAVGMYVSQVPYPQDMDTVTVINWLLPVAATLEPVTSTDALYQWKLWQSEYVATGGERHIAIGNFHPDAQTTGIVDDCFFHETYLYIDEASVILVGDSVSVCGGDSVTLNAQGGPGYTWIMAADTDHTVLSTAAAIRVSPAVTTSYIAYGATDTVVYNVYVTPALTVGLGADTVFCAAGSLQLAPVGNNLSGAQYLWQDGSTGPHFTPVQTGIYWVQASLGACMAADSIHITVDPAVAVSLGPDVHFCAGDSVLLQAIVFPASLQPLWQDLSTGATLPVYAAGNYSVTVEQGTCQAADTVTVTEDQPPVVSLGNDTALCGIGPLILNATIPGAQYVWTGGLTLPAVAIHATGLYAVEVTLGACSVSDSIYVAFVPLPQVSLGPDTVLCVGETLLLDVQAPGRQYRWNDGSAAPAFTVAASGSYSVVVTDSNGCQASDNLVITYIAAPQVSFADTVLCDGSVWTLTITNPLATYLWSDKTTGAQYTVTGPGTYWGEAGNRCGVAADTVQVQYRSCECLLYIPTGFTPNGDAGNERFGPVPVAGCGLTEYTFGVYDRWGGLIYQTANPEQPWDGRLAGQICPNGLYAYRVAYRFQGDALTLRQGSVVLVR